MPHSKVSSTGCKVVATRDYLQRIERMASQLRQIAGVGQFDKLDPYEHTQQFGIDIVEPSRLNAILAAADIDLDDVNVKTWSGAALPTETGNWLVLLHPQQTRERAVVTIMEEVAHKFMGHKPTRLSLLDNGSSRGYDQQSEADAYWTAAASLLPAKAVSMAVWRSRTAESIANEFGTSVELAEFRIKTLHLWSLRSERRAA
jgi:hypothetical protein